MNELIKINIPDNFFEWLNMGYLPDSKGYKFEIDSEHDLKSMFFILFDDFKENFYVGQFPLNSPWGEFCLDSIDTNEMKYETSIETEEYLCMLNKNGIEFEYTGYCACYNWDFFLKKILSCIMSHKAPYSPLVYDPLNCFVFYFHHTGSIGFYYKELNENIIGIIKNSNANGYHLHNYSDERVKLF